MTPGEGEAALEGRTLSTGRLARAARVPAALALLYAGAIFWVSHQSNPFPAAAALNDKVVHAVIYAVLGLLVRLALAGTRLRGLLAIAAAVALASCYGVSDEFHQAFIPNRQADVKDWAADTTGAALGALAAAAFLRRRARAG